MIIQKTTKKIRAVGKYIHMSPHKVRRVLDQIRGKSYKEAILILEFLPYRAAKPVKNILKSATANAVYNYQFEKNDLIVKETFVNQGPTLKRIRPRAQGKAFSIHKPTCHISISVTNNS